MLCYYTVWRSYYAVLLYSMAIVLCCATIQYGLVLCSATIQYGLVITMHNGLVQCFVSIRNTSLFPQDMIQDIYITLKLTA